MLKYIKGDIFTTKCNIIAHGVNCRGVFNAGVAQQIRKKYPQAFNSYIMKYSTLGWRTGDVQVVKIPQEQNRFVANLATQYEYGRNGKYASCDNIELCLEKLVAYALKYGLSIACPVIGSGYGGLAVTDVKEIFEKIAKQSLVYMEVYSL